MRTRQVIRYTLLTLAIGAGTALMNTQHEEKTEYHPRDYAEIAESGVLRAVTEYNSVSYHVTGDTVEGFDYELLHAFATDKGLRLELHPVMSFEERLEGVCQGRYDLLAAGTLVNTRSKDSLLFTRTLLQGKQVLVQRKSAGPDDSLFLRNQLDLAHKRLYVVKGSPALLRLHHLISEMADTIYIEEVEQYGQEQLLAMVAGGDIDYAVCEERIARNLLPEFPELDTGTDISFTQFYAWGTGRRSPALLDSLNAWLDTYIPSRAYQQLLRTYFKKTT
ncbi:MAG: transporter substrate-binding domain-containing protein [Bacteroidales bacterium]|nr:transporter substrate-binding domain-containing protein [Bacteroidales bacterium]